MKSKALVLRTVKYNDTSFIAHLLTEQCGCIGMMVHMSRSKRAAVRHTLFQPLTVLDLEWDERPRASLQRPKQAAVALPFTTLPYDSHKSAMALFLAEFLYHVLKGDSDSGAVFAYVVRSLEWLDTCTKGYANFHLVFLLRLTRLLGFTPNLDEARSGCCFDLRSGCYTPSQPLHNDYLSAADAALLPKLMRMRYDNMHVFKFNGSERARLLERINLYYSLHLPGFPALKSLAVLRELF